MKASRQTTQAEKIQIAGDDRNYRILGYCALLVTFVFFFGWASLAPLQSAVVAKGRIIVSSQNKIVQHLDGGLVKEIKVKDGDLVEQGQLLLSLDDTSLQIQLENTREQLLEVRASLERLIAERDEKPELQFSDALRRQAASESADRILKTQQQLFQSRRQAQVEERDVLQQRLAQAEKQITHSKRLIETLRQRLALVNEDLKGLRQLAEKNLVSKSKLREVQRVSAELQGDIVEQQGVIAGLEESKPEIMHQISLRKEEYKSEVNSGIHEFRSRQSDLSAHERDLLDKLSRIAIRAPVAGKVKGFNVVTLGAVIKAGEPIMEIVPLAQEFDIQARVSPMDIDVLHSGLKAEVRFPVFDGARRFPSLYASLQDISIDTYRDESNDQSYYKATLKVDPGSTGVLAERHLQLVSGMLVDVMINTGERTLMDYLIAPFEEMLARAFNEA